MLDDLFPISGFLLFFSSNKTDKNSVSEKFGLKNAKYSCENEGSVLIYSGCFLH